jgi:hypothetical protein
LLPGIDLFAGGKSFGGRMTSQAQFESPLPEVRGVVFLGFPLHPPGQPATERGKHLFNVQVPMLFLQGARDEFANWDLIQPLTNKPCLSGCLPSPESEGAGMGFSFARSLFEPCPVEEAGVGLLCVP